MESMTNRFVLGLVFMMCNIIVVVSGTAQSTDCTYRIEGRVLDMETEAPLAFATVVIEETGQSEVSDANGVFSMQGLCEEEVHLEVKFLGYKTAIHHHDYHHGDPIIYLASNDILLESVVIEASKVSSYRTAAIQSLEFDEIELLSTSIGELTEKLSGINSLKTGANISKPIIHGLHSNRVLVINDGLRHAYQVWGEGHAPEIDPSHVDAIEVVKGAATVKYGPEALGGVVLYNNNKPQLDHQLTGSFGSSYQTNGRAYSSQLSISQGSHRFAWEAGGSGVVQGDLQAPDYNLSNTGKREYGGSFKTLYHLPNMDLQLSGSYLDQSLGILRASIVGNLQDLQNAIDRGVPSPTFDRTNNIQNPRHEVQHALLKSKLTYYHGEQIFKFSYGLQKNIRREFDVRRGELNDRPIIDLDLLSHNIDIEWIQSTAGIWSGNSGIQLYTQDSRNEPGSNPVNFVPDYKVLNLGAYSIQSLDFGKTILELGLRLDYQNLSVADTIRDVATYSNELNFQNATFTIGIKHHIKDGLSIYSNIGSAWRPPNVAELYSFGFNFSRIQFGLWRYDFNPNIFTPVDEVFDQTVRAVPSEKSYKWITGLEYQNERINSEFVVYANRIDDYIFLRPFGISVNVAGTFPFFIFSQTDALFLGGDWNVRYKHSEQFSSEAKVSYVYATELENDQPFIEIPPFNVNYELAYKNANWKAAIRMDYMAQQWNAPRTIEPILFQNGGAEFAQNEIFDFMDAPEAFLLVGAKLSYHNETLNVELKGDNLFNQTYRSNTDRLRYFSDAQGRNISLSVGIQF